MTVETRDRLQHLLQDVADAGAADEVSVADVLASAANRSFGLRARISRRRLAAAFGAVRPLARVLDRVFRPRLRVLINHWTFSLVAVICAGLAATMPPLEILPFTATITALIIAMFAMSLIYEDGLLMLLALTGTIGVTVVIAVYALPRLGEVLG